MSLCLVVCWPSYDTQDVTYLGGKDVQMIGMDVGFFAVWEAATCSTLEGPLLFRCK